MAGNYIIIGASSGIGKNLAERLAKEHKVIGTYKNNEIESYDIDYQYYDVTSSDALKNLPDVIDGLVYCPGLINLKPFHRISENEFIEDYKVQVIGTIKTIQQCLPALKRSENSSIVLFSTVAVQTGFTFHSLVASSKGAIEGLTKSLAAELAPKIRVNCIAPSLTNTPLAASLLSTEEKIKINAERHPLKRIGEADDVAQLAEFLLSNKSTWITGQILHIDGGLSSIK